MNNPAQRFSELLQAHTQTAADLLDILEQEFALLGGNDASGLEDFARAKGQRLGELQSCSAELDGLLQTAGVTNDKAGVAQYIQQHDAANELGLAQQWQEMIALVDRCQHQNEVNGTVIVLRHRAAQQLLVTLTGQANSQTYDPHGKTQSATSSQSLAKA